MRKRTVSGGLSRLPVYHLGGGRVREVPQTDVIGGRVLGAALGEQESHARRSDSGSRSMAIFIAGQGEGFENGDE